MADLRHTAEISERGHGTASARERQVLVAVTSPALALPVITTVLGMQLIRLLIPTIYNYVGEALGMSTVNMGVLALLLFGLSFLSGVVRRLLGPRLALAVSAGGVAMFRVLAQLIPVPAVDLYLSTAGVVLFLWFLPIYLGSVRGDGPRATARYAQAILLGLALDAGIQGAAGTVDLVWQSGLLPAIVVLLLAALLLLSLARLRGEPPSPYSDGRFLPTLALAGLGLYLVLQGMLLQNTAAWATLTGWGVPGALAAVLISYAVALAGNATLAPRLDRGARSRLVLFVGAVFLVLLLAFPQQGILAAFLLVVGQVLAASGLLVIFVSAGEQAGRTGLWRTAVGSGIGSLLFVVLVFLYFASYWIHLPLESSAVLPIAAALFAVFVAIAATGLPRQPQETQGRVSYVPAGAVATLLVLPLALAVAWRAPAPVMGNGLPVRVMSYNLHHGYNMAGRMDLESIARNIESSGADVVGLQEVTRGWFLDSSMDMVSWLSQRLGMPYVYTAAVDPYFGNAVLSRLPVKEWGHGRLPQVTWEMRRSYVWARLDAGGGDEFTFVSTHTHHVYPGQGEIRMAQMTELVRFWGQRPGMVFVGDLNAPSTDPEIRLFADAGLKDAFVRAGSGEGLTHPADNPDMRIDYIWMSPDLRASDFRIIKSTASDHLPVSAAIGR